MHLHKPTLAEIPLLIEVWRRSISQATTDQHYQKQKLEAMESDPEKYLASLDDLSGGGELELEDGSKVKRLPSRSEEHTLNSSHVSESRMPSSA